VIEPNRWFLSKSLEDARVAIRDLERLMSNFHFVDAAAEDVRDLAKRLDALTRPDKGHLKDGAKAFPLKDAA
jgi:hypothetical protein